MCTAEKNKRTDNTGAAAGSEKVPDNCCPGLFTTVEDDMFSRAVIP